MGSEINLQDVSIHPLKQIFDDRGAVMHMLRADQAHFQKFGEIYFSFVNPGVVKGWKFHKEISQSMAVPEGKIRLVIYDPRKESKSFGKVQIIEFGENNYCLVQLPPQVWYAFQAVSSGRAMIANCTTAPHSADESQVLPLGSDLIPYQW